MKVLKRSAMVKDKLHAFIEPDYRKVRLVAMPMVEKILKEAGVPYQTNYTDNIIKPIWSSGKSGIVFLSGQDPSSVIAYTLASVHLDEPSMMKPEIYDNASGRVRAATGTFTQMSYSLTWDGVPNNWTYKMFWENPMPDLALYLAPTYENVRNVGERYIKNLENTLTTEKRKVYLNGLPVNVNQGSVYWAFNREKHVVDSEALPYQESLPVGFCFDFNYNPMTCTIVQWTKTSSYAIDEIIQKQSNTIYMVDALKDWILTHCKNRLNAVNIYGDPAGRSHSSKSTQTDYDIIYDGLKQIVPEVNIRVAASHPLVSDRISFTNLQLCKDLEIKISNKCVNLIRDYENILFDKNGAVDKKSDASLTHSADNHDYYLWEQFRNCLTIDI